MSFNTPSRLKGFLSTVFVTSLLLSGCDLVSLHEGDTGEAIEEPELAALYTEIVEDLGLPAEEQAEVRRIFVKHQRTHQQAGNLWRIAAAMQERLTNEQKERLFAMIAEYEAKLAESGKLWLFENWTMPGQASPNRPDCNLRLTQEQMREMMQVRAEFGELFSQLQNAFRQGRITAEEFRRRSSALREALQEAYDEILTEEQRLRWRACQNWVADRVDQVRSSGFEVMIRVLELDAEQVRALENLRSRQREAYALLVRQLREGEIDREAFIDAIMEIVEARDERLQEILNRKQYEILKIHQGLSLRMHLNRLANASGNR